MVSQVGKPQTPLGASSVLSCPHKGYTGKDGLAHTLPAFTSSWLGREVEGPLQCPVHKL